jgi:hypothetical protein
MGALIPIGGGADAEITGHLNAAFNETNLRIVRDVHKGEKIFDGRHKLHRIAYRLGTYPIRTYSGDNAKGKWFYFLKKTLKDATLNGNLTTDSIKAILSYAMRITSVKRVVFDARLGTDANLDHYVDPNNPMTDNDIARLVDTTGTLTVALICPAPLGNNTAQTPNQTGDLDRDSNGNIIERPPIKIFEPQNLAPPALSRTTRKPKGKKKVKKAPKAKGQ